MALGRLGERVDPPLPHGLEPWPHLVARVLEVQLGRLDPGALDQERVLQSGARAGAARGLEVGTTYQHTEQQRGRGP